METALAVVAGVLIACGVYLMMAGHIMRFMFGLMLLGNAANLTLFVAGRLTRADPPLIPDGLDVPMVDAANALPQALVLTAIVIGFGLLAFVLALIYRAYQSLGTLESDEMRVAEPEGPER